MADTGSFKPEFLISQSTHTCLTVISGTGEDAVIGMAKCTGGVKQQWFAKDGQWLWVGNQTLCLSKNKAGELCLAPCNTQSQSWLHDDQGRLVINHEALDVPWQNPRVRVILYPKHSDINQKWWTLSQLKACLHGKQLAGEHCLPPHIFEMSKKEIDRCSSVRKSLLKSGVECHCRVGSDFVMLSQAGEVISETNTPEYLISQSTLTCLTVLNGTGPRDASIGLAPFTGNITQQWLVQGTVWVWAGNPSFCLVPDWSKGTLVLTEVSRSRTSWNFDEQGMMEMYSNVLDVPWDNPRTRVIVYPKHGGENQRWWRLSHVKAQLQRSPEMKTAYPEGLIQMSERMTIQKESHQCHCHDKVESLPHIGWKIAAAVEEPEYLISQSTSTCLTVLDSSCPNNATIGLVPYTGDARQQWFVNDGIWKWGQDQRYCLVPDFQKGMVKLALCKETNSSWTLDNDGVFMNASHALDVPWEGDRTKVILYPRHGAINQKWWCMSSLKSCVGCRIYPIPVEDGKTYKEEVARGILNRLCPLTEPLPHPRDVDHYPGTVAPGTPRKDLMHDLAFGTVQQRSNLRMTVPEDWQATNIYVVAGDIFTVTLPGITEKQAEKITVRVGAHRDCLDPMSPNLQKGVFKRMPIVSEEFDVNPGMNRLRSQFGGNLIFTYEGKERFRTTAQVQNVVETPHYILGKSSLKDWNKMKCLDAPFSVLETDKVVLIVPTKEARCISDIDNLLHRYDDIMTKLEDLSGFTETDPPPQGKQWMVDDVQISAGSAHAGFPAMFDHQFYDLTSPETPHDWVVWHELGHNYQQGSYWSYAYGSETTVNLFSLYIEEKLKADDRLKRENRYMPAVAAVNKGLTFERADCWQKLVFLMEIKHAFPSHGWDMYRHLNRTVRGLSEHDATLLKSSRQNQYDFVYVTLSRFIGTDLLPHYQRWSLPVSLKAQSEVSSLGLPKAPENLSLGLPKAPGNLF